MKKIDGDIKIRCPKCNTDNNVGWAMIEIMKDSFISDSFTEASGEIICWYCNTEFDWNIENNDSKIYDRDYKERFEKYAGTE